MVYAKVRTLTTSLGRGVRRKAIVEDPFDRIVHSHYLVRDLSYFT